jgi:leucyl aminopeptidase
MHPVTAPIWPGRDLFLTAGASVNEDIMDIAFSPIDLTAQPTLVVGVLDERVLSPSAEAADAATDGALRRALAAGRFTGKRGQTLTLAAPTGLGVDRVVMLGLGAAVKLDALAAQEAGGALLPALNAQGATKAAVAIDPLEGDTLAPAQIAANLACGVRLRAYRFDKYRTKEKAEDKPTLSAFTAMVADPDAARDAHAPLAAIAAGVEFTRDLVSEPGNVVYPESFAEHIEGLAELGIDVEILGKEAMAVLGMGALLSVGDGSVRESKLAVMRWNGASDPDAAPVAFVGKGVTFDTGGISIKPSASMEEMKYDMAGAGCVAGLMKALAGRKARVNAVGIIGLVENMPSGSATRPGDVVTSMSGQTIEVINTDAEGRLVLSDALYYTHTRFKPHFMVDLATLTGAIVVALGTYQAGLFCNDDELAERIMDAGESVGEKAWRMPLGERYDKDVNSEIADMKNVGKGREAGSVTAAQFLQRFVGETKWAHLDIAGMAWCKKDTPLVPLGAAGFGVRLLDRLVAEHYED